MRTNKLKIEKFGQELALLVKNFIGTEGLNEWIEAVNPELFKIEKINKYNLLSLRDKHIKIFEPEQDFAVEFLVFVMWGVSHTVQQFFLKKNRKPEIISGLNPHFEVNMITKESTLVLDVFHREIYKWLERAWGKKDLSIFEEFIDIRHQDYYNYTGSIESGFGIEIPSLASGVLVKIIEEKSKQNWVEKLKQTKNKGEIKDIIINRYFVRIFEDIRKLVKDTYKKFFNSS